MPARIYFVNGETIDVPHGVGDIEVTLRVPDVTSTTVETVDGRKVAVQTEHVTHVIEIST